MYTINSVLERINQGDITLFNAVVSQTTGRDRRSLLSVFAAMPKQYNYLEIGSYLGGTLQPALLDSRCKHIVSIDKRPKQVGDERNFDVVYNDNTTDNMLRGLRQFFDVSRVVCIDASTEELSPSDIPHKPDFSFIDGAHTHSAVISDFRFCRLVMKDRGVIAFHDYDIIKKAVKQAESELVRDGVAYSFALLPTSVAVFVMGDQTIKAVGKHFRTTPFRNVYRESVLFLRYHMFIKPKFVSRLIDLFGALRK